MRIILAVSKSEEDEASKASRVERIDDLILQTQRKLRDAEMRQRLWNKPLKTIAELRDYLRVLRAEKTALQQGGKDGPTAVPKQDRAITRSWRKSWKRS